MEADREDVLGDTRKGVRQRAGGCHCRPSASHGARFWAPPEPLRGRGSAPTAAAATPSPRADSCPPNTILCHTDTSPRGGSADTGSRGPDDAAVVATNGSALACGPPSEDLTGCGVCRPQRLARRLPPQPLTVNHHGRLKVGGCDATSARSCPVLSLVEQLAPTPTPVRVQPSNPTVFLVSTATECAALQVRPAAHEPFVDSHGVAARQLALRAARPRKDTSPVAHRLDGPVGPVSFTERRLGPTPVEVAAAETVVVSNAALPAAPVCRGTPSPPPPRASARVSSRGRTTPVPSRSTRPSTQTPTVPTAATIGHARTFTAGPADPPRSRHGSRKRKAPRRHDSCHQLARLPIAQHDTTGSLACPSPPTCLRSTT